MAGPGSPADSGVVGCRSPALRTSRRPVPTNPACSTTQNPFPTRRITNSLMDEGTVRFRTPRCSTERSEPVDDVSRETRRDRVWRVTPRPMTQRGVTRPIAGVSRETLGGGSGPRRPVESTEQHPPMTHALRTHRQRTRAETTPAGDEPPRFASIKPPGCRHNRMPPVDDTSFEASEVPWAPNRPITRTPRPGAKPQAMKRGAPESAPLRNRTTSS